MVVTEGVLDSNACSSKDKTEAPVLVAVVSWCDEQDYHLGRNRTSNGSIDLGHRSKDVQVDVVEMLTSIDKIDAAAAPATSPP